MSDTTDSPRSSTTLTLAAVPSAIGCAGLFVRYVLTRWHLAGILPAAENAASELVARAVETPRAQGTESGWLDLDDRAFLRIRLIVTSTRLLIEVWDRDETPPAAVRPNPELGTDRTAGSAAAGHPNHGYYHTHEGGKVAWAEFNLPNRLRPSPLSAPRPTPRP